jgi:hypothetical protein
VSCEVVVETHPESHAWSDTAEAMPNFSIGLIVKRNDLAVQWRRQRRAVQARVVQHDQPPFSRMDRSSQTDTR